MYLYALLGDDSYSQNWIQVSQLAYLSLIPVDTTLDVAGLRDLGSRFEY